MKKNNISILQVALTIKWIDRMIKKSYKYYNKMK